MKKTVLTLILTSIFVWVHAAERDSLKVISQDSSIYNFVFEDVQGKPFTLNKFKGKVIFIDFWFTGCSACVGYYNNLLRHVEKFYHNDKEIVFISISIDKDRKQWLNTVNNGYPINKDGYILRQTDENGINLRCLKWQNSEVLNYFHITGYPTSMLFDKNGNLFNRSRKNLRLDGIDSIKTYIELAKNKK